MSKVIVADDHIATRKMIQVALEKNGYDVIAVNDGLQAWSLLSSKPSLQLAILDWDMPGLDGVEIVHPNLKEDRVEVLNKIVQGHHLLVSGGSDCHGGRDGHINIGRYNVPYAILDQMKEVLRRRWKKAD